MKTILRICVLTAVVGFSSVDTASAVEFNFGNITGNNAANANTGETQITLDVTDAGPGFVDFRFTNAGPNASVITEIYFEDGTLLEVGSVFTSDPGVNYTEDTPNTGNLPGGNSVSPQFNVSGADYIFQAVDADNPAPDNGVNPGEWVTIRWQLIPGKTFADTLAAMYAGLDPDTYYDGGWTVDHIRVGIHVQAFGDGGSESFIVVPAPGAAVLAALGLGGIGWVRRRFA